MAAPRTVEQRKKDVIQALEANHDLWLATADPMGRPHLIAASAWWDGSLIVVATVATSRTARNLAQNGVARLAIGTPEDVVMVDANLEDSAPAREAPDDLTSGFKKAAGWDPREVGDNWVFYRLRPGRVQAYRGYDELEGRDVMTKGRWLA